MARKTCKVEVRYRDHRARGARPQHKAYVDVRVPREVVPAHTSRSQSAVSHRAVERLAKEKFQAKFPHAEIDMVNVIACTPRRRR